MTTAAFAPPESIDRRATAIAAVGLGAGIGLLATAVRLPSVCPFRICTGQACPGCGLTRSIGHAVRGDLGASWQLHPLGVLVGLQLLGAVALLAAHRDRSVAALLTQSRWVLAANAVLLLVVWAIRWRLGLFEPVLA